MAETQLMRIPLNRIRENPVALRSVNRTDENYLELVHSIKDKGVINPIAVREVKSPVNNEVFYSLVDGLQRYSASQDAGLTDIPAQVVSMQDGEILEAQIIANVHRIETKPVEYSNQLKRILGQNPFLTSQELAARLSKSPAWLDDRLGLSDLPKEVGSLVDDGKINLSNAYVLAKLAKAAPEELKNYLDRAQTQSPQEFVPTVAQRIKELRDAKRQGRDAATVEFVPPTHLRKLSEIKNEHEKPTVGPLLVKENNCKDAAAGFALGVKWTLHQDPRSLEAAKVKEAARKVQQEADKKKREIEREEKKKQDAQTSALKKGDLESMVAPPKAPAAPAAK